MAQRSLFASVITVLPDDSAKSDLQIALKLSVSMESARRTAMAAQLAIVNKVLLVTVVR
jgi:hypothetical protein